MKSLPIAVVALCAIGLYLTGATAGPTGDNGEPQLTSTLVAWISSQCEMIVEEMEAIVKTNSETSSFSLVSYMRYLNLYNELRVVAARNLDELKWVARKLKAFSRVYNSAMRLVSDHLVDLDSQLLQIELHEPKSKQVGVSQGWLNLYETIRYIATHAPKDTELERSATAMLSFTPTGSSDKIRATRYELKKSAFSR